MYSEIDFRIHYRSLRDMGIVVMQGADEVDEDDFVAIGKEGGMVDLWRNGKRLSANTRIGGSSEEGAIVA